jgi:hypothetical protein
MKTEPEIEQEQPGILLSRSKPKPKKVEQGPQ